MSTAIFDNQIMWTIQVWGSLFQWKRKQKFIPLTISIGNFKVKNIYGNDENVTYPNVFKLNELEEVKVFDLQSIFSFHLNSTRYCITFLEMQFEVFKTITFFPILHKFYMNSQVLFPSLIYLISNIDSKSKVSALHSQDNTSNSKG